MENFESDIITNIKHEPEEHFVIILPAVAETNLQAPETQNHREIIGDIKYELEEHFVLVLPESEMLESPKKTGDVSKSSRNGSFQCKTCKRKKFDAEKVYNCYFCKLEFSCDNCRAKHVTQDHRRGSHWLCVSCNFSTLYEKGIKAHYRTHYSSCKYFNCTMCKSSFATKHGLSKHIRTVHSYLESQCDICGKTSRNKFQLKRHMQIHLKATCPICQHSLASHRLNYHIKQHSSSASFQCNTCSKDFSTLRYLNKHKQRVHKLEEAQCDFCGKTFKNKGLLKVHVLNHAKISCPVCRRPVNKILMKQHIKMSHSGGNPLLACGIKSCKTKFPCNKEALRHQETHIGIDRYQCPKCNYEAKSWWVMKKHMKSH